MNSTFHVSVIIPWKSGNSQRENSLRNLLNCLAVQELDNNSISYELIIVEQTTTVKDTVSVPKEISSYNYFQLIYSTDLFNKSWCMNVGARLARYNNLLFVDADSLFGKDYLQQIKMFLRQLQSPYNKIIFCWNYLIGLPGKDNPISRHITPASTRAMGGIWYCDKEFYFEKLGGMNENYSGYGGEDNDAYERASVLIGPSGLSILNYPLVHQYHDWEKPSSIATKYFEITRYQPKVIIAKLKEIGIGKTNAPSLIDMGDK